MTKPRALVNDLMTRHYMGGAVQTNAMRGAMHGVAVESGDERVGDVVRFLVLGSRGGTTRRRILAVLFRCPQNAHRICQTLSLNYGTVASHLRVMEGFGLVTAIGESRYNRGYCISPLLRGSRTVVDLIRDANAR